MWPRRGSSARRQHQAPQSFDSRSDAELQRQRVATAQAEAQDLQARRPGAAILCGRCTLPPEGQAAASHGGSGRRVATGSAKSLQCGEAISRLAGERPNCVASSAVDAEVDSTGVIPRTAHQTSARWAAAARLPRHQLAVHEVGHKSFPCLVSAPTTPPAPDKNLPAPLHHLFFSSSSHTPRIVGIRTCVRPTPPLLLCLGHCTDRRPGLQLTSTPSSRQHFHTVIMGYVAARPRPPVAPTPPNAY